MATNKNATIRYQALNKCFRNPGRKYFIDDLIDTCNNALADINDSTTGVKKRQVYDDIKFMKDSKGYDAPISSLKEGRSTYYRYSDINFSINNQPLNEQEAQQLKESLVTLSRFKGMPQFEWIEELKARLEESFNLKTEDNVISFEENRYLSGREFIADLFNAIVYKKCLSIRYKPFKSEDELLFTLHPYHIKQYNNRWFLFGLNEEEDIISNIALDRIVSMTDNNLKYKDNTEIDFEEYFDDVIGVSIPYEGKIDNVLLQIDKRQWPYVRTKPMHGSQKTVEISDESVIISLQLISNYELESLILSFGDNIEVLEPKELKERIKLKVKNNYKKYFG